MPGPGVLARMKQTNHAARFGGDGGEVASLERVAPKAGPGKVVFLRRATMFAGDDMIGAVGHPHVVFMDQAVLAAEVRPFPNELPQGGRDILTHDEEFFGPRALAL